MRCIIIGLFLVLTQVATPQNLEKTDNEFCVYTLSGERGPCDIVEHWNQKAELLASAVKGDFVRMNGQIFRVHRNDDSFITLQAKPGSNLIIVPHWSTANDYFLGIVSDGPEYNQLERL